MTTANLAFKPTPTALLAAPEIFYTRVMARDVAPDHIPDVIEGLQGFAQWLQPARSAQEEEYAQAASRLDGISHTDAALPSAVRYAAERLKFVQRSRLRQVANDLVMEGCCRDVSNDLVMGARAVINPTEHPVFMAPLVSGLLEIDNSLDLLPTSFAALKADSRDIPGRTKEYERLLEVQDLDRGREVDRLQMTLDYLAQAVRDLDVGIYEQVIERVEGQYPDHQLILAHRGAHGLDLALQSRGHATIPLNISERIVADYPPYQGRHFEAVQDYFTQQGLKREDILDPDKKFLIIDNGMVGNVINWIRFALIAFAGLEPGSPQANKMLERFPGLLTFASLRALFPGIVRAKGKDNQEIFADQLSRVRRQAVMIEELRPHAHHVATLLVQWAGRVYPMHVRDPSNWMGGYNYPARVSQAQKLRAWRWQVEVIKAFS